MAETRAEKPADLVEHRCCQCHKLLCKSSADAVRSGSTVEIKCHGCNAMNYLTGRDVAA